MMGSSGGSLITSKLSSSEMKRADKRSSITILVLGDEGVGKSSLISTFVSRYFSEVVPGIMTRVRLPPDPKTSCVTTVVDSQGGDAALMQAVSSAMQRQRSEQEGLSLLALLERASSSSDAAAAAASPAGQQGGVSETATPRGSSRQVDFEQLGAIENVDSIVLVYDLDRVETFFRLENHWLPLIQRCYGGKVPVIVAENKMDLFRPSSSGIRGNVVAAAVGAAAGADVVGQTDEQALARKRQQIVSLMQQFPFVRQCIKCSAKNLLRVDDVFLKAQQAVLYPFVPPLYNLEMGQMTIECKRAFTRIFRMFDKDHDGLLSDAELNRFQRDTYHVAVFDRDLAAWKKVVTRNNPSEDNEPVLEDGKFTIQGFLTIFDVFISQNRLDVVWQCLRKYNYDDDLNLHVPDSVANPSDDASTTSSAAAAWKLTPSAKKFLTQLFRQFDSDKDGLLSPDDIVSMFSILPPPCLPPWHPMRAPELFEGCFSIPKESLASQASSGSDSPPQFEGDPSLIVPAAMSQSLISTSGVSILSASDSWPSIDVGGMHPLSPSLSFLEWMGHWHALSAICPSVTRAELYRLGHVEDRKARHSSGSFHRRAKKMKILAEAFSAGEDASGAKSDVFHDLTLTSRVIRVLVLGSRGCGKTSLLNALCGAFDGSFDVKATDTSNTSRPETSATFVKMRRKLAQKSGTGKVEPGQGEEIVVHLVFTDVPEAAAARQEEHYRDLSELFGSTASPKDRVCDLAMLVFDCTDSSSFSAVKELEARLLTNETPRVFVGTKTDLVTPPEPEDGDARPATVSDEAEIHCRESDLEPPFLTSASENGLGAGNGQRSKALDYFARCALGDEPGIGHLKSRPHEEQKRREAARRKRMMWIGGIVSVGVVVAVGVSLLLGGSGKTKDQKSGFGWFRSWFGGGPRVSQDSPQSA